MKTLCNEHSCKVRAHPKFDTITKLWEQGNSAREIAEWTKDHEPSISHSTINKHFKKHLVNPLELDEVGKESFSPYRLGEIISDRIEEINELIHEERNKEDTSSRTIAKLMDTQRRLIEDQIKNRELYFENVSEEPKEILKKFKEVISQPSFPTKSKEQLVEVLEGELNL